MPNISLRQTGLAALVAAMLSGCAAKKPIATQHMLVHEYTVRDPHFVRVMSDLLGPKIVGGNSITTLVNGEEFYPAQLEAIRSAQHSITFETYVYEESEIGREFAEALAERARNGVEVCVLLDAIGYDGSYFNELREAGAHVIEYHPVARITLLLTLGDVTQRTHRKILVIDGVHGFIGGAGVADFWQGDARSPEEWRDTMYHVQGPVVAHLQSAFVENWIQSTGELLDEQIFLPEISPVGDMHAQVFQSSPEGGAASMELMYLVAITAAEETIDIATPYFVPTDLMETVMLDALARGVRIRLIIPGPHIDHAVTKDASRPSWKALLQAGLELYEYQPTMYHHKMMIIDGYWTSLGSANLDLLSFRLNDEANLNVFSEAFAREQTELLEADLAQSAQVTEFDHDSRSLIQRVMEFLSMPFRPIL